MNKKLLLIIIPVLLLLIGGVAAYFLILKTEDGTPGVVPGPENPNGTEQPIVIEEKSPVKVISPRGGEQIETGGILTVEWEPPEGHSDVILRYTNGPYKHEQRVQNTGKYQLDIPLEKPSSRAQIEITPVGEPELAGHSGEFTTRVTVSTEEWLEFADTEYGIHMLYPEGKEPQYLERNINERLAVQFGNIVISVRDRANLDFRDAVTCVGTHYDVELETWLYSRSCEVDLPEPVCAGDTVGIDDMPAVTMLSSQATTPSFSHSIVLTNKGYALMVTVISDDTESEEDVKMKFKMLDTLDLVSNTIAIDPPCGSGFPSKDEFQPVLIKPAVGGEVKLSRPFNLILKDKLPNNIGGFIYVSTQADSYQEELLVGEFLPGTPGAGIKPIASNLSSDQLSQLSGDGWFHIQWYGVIGKKKLLLSSEMNTTLLVNFINDIKSELAIEENPLVIKDFKTKGGRVVLDRGDENEEILHVVGVNVRDCFIEDNGGNSEAKMEKKELGTVTNLVRGIYVADDFPTGEKIFVTVGCETPTDKILTESLEFVSN